MIGDKDFLGFGQLAGQTSSLKFCFNENVWTNQSIDYLWKWKYVAALNTTQISPVNKI